MRYREIIFEMAADKIWYHGTSKNFAKFSNAYTTGQLGVHLGTKEQAEWRLGDESGFILLVIADVHNLIHLNDSGGWYGSGVVEQLKTNPLTKELKWWDSMSDRHIARQLQSLGFDGVIYQNMHEGEEHTDSIIVFDANRLSIVEREIWSGEITT